MRAICKFSLTLAATTILPLLAIGVSLMGSPALEKVDSRRHGLGRARQNATAPTMAMPFVAPLFLQDSQFSSTLSLVNASRLHTYATVTVRSLDGQTILERQVPLAPSSPAQVDVQQLLLEANSAETRGSIIIEQSSDLKGMAVLAQLSITYQGSRASYIDEELAMPNPTMGSSILRGVVRGHSDSALVAISSLSQTPQKVEVDCLGQGNPMSKMVDLAPNATVITNACDKGDLGSQPLTDIREEESSNGASPVGIQLSSNAGPAQFAAFGLTRHLAGGELFLGAIPFNDPKTAVSSSTVFAGLPVGAAEILGSGPYEPYLAVANFSLLPAHVTVSFSQTSGAPGAATASNNMVAHIRLQPQNTKIVSFGDLQGDPDMRNSFVVTSDGAPGDIAVSMASKDLRGQAEVELLGKDAQQHENAGVHPWSLDSGDDPILLLFNHTDQPQRVIINILDGGSLWKKTVKLAPSETLQMHIADLIRNQVSDDSRRTLPKNLTQGQVNWIMDGLHTVTGRVLLSNAQTFMARNFSCAAYNVLCGASISPYGPTMNIGDSLYFHGTPSAVLVTPNTLARDPALPTLPFPIMGGQVITCTYLPVAQG